LAEARIYDRSLLDRAKQELKRQYLSRGGRYGVKVKTTVSPLERNRVNISISVDEGEVRSDPRHPVHRKPRVFGFDLARPDGVVDARLG